MSTTTLEDGECPACGSLIHAIAANSPTECMVQPCGCTIPKGTTPGSGGEGR
ncbi:hypothetical protein [Halorussus aquaticus]|uniref:Small CPxCG-related zinc finger protein n=1 Tax=Halorussus aquaticus TaxID=2953748 RepID=A0ABD5Q8J6_9EURY|nr:hypothetical protein [Halorussus aquaticus]